MMDDSNPQGLKINERVNKKRNRDILGQVTFANTTRHPTHNLIELINKAFIVEPTKLLKIINTRKPSLYFVILCICESVVEEKSEQK